MAVKDQVESAARAVHSTVARSPAGVLGLMLSIGLLSGLAAVDFSDQIEDGVEIYLPDGAESTQLLSEVRTEWTTDVVIVYLTTTNKELGGGLGENVTDVRVLEEMSQIEGDDRPSNNGMDFDRTDRGRMDGIIWTLSISQVIKEANSSQVRFREASCEHVAEDRLPLFDCSAVQLQDDAYAIPDQDRVDDIVGQLSDSLSGLAVDTNDDGIWDTAAINFGVISDWDCEGCLTPYLDDRAFVSELESRLAARSDTTTIPMEVTGLNTILQDISDRIYLDLEKLIPISLLFVCITIALLHRDVRIVLICGVPVVLSLVVTLGMTVALDILLTPMIIAAAPLLIGLGVDYALHLANRIDETRNEWIAEGRFDDPWDFEGLVEASVHATMTTGRAITISALTTSIGFGVLILPMITPVKPMRTVGLTLVVGILLDLVFTILLVPLMMRLLKYQRGAHDTKWTLLGETSRRGWIPVLVGVTLVSLWGAGMIGEQLSKPITAADETPDNIPSMEAMINYSSEFQSGQISMYIMDADERGSTNGTTAIRDIAVLDAMDELAVDVGEVPATNTTSAVDFLKSINVELDLQVQKINMSLWELTHHECWESNAPQCAPWLIFDASDSQGRAGWRSTFVDIAFDTLSEEVQALLFNDEETKALVYVNQRYMNLDTASGLRDQIDVLLDSGVELQGVEVSNLTGGLPVSLDVNKGVHDAQSRTTLLTLLVLTIALTALYRSIRLGLMIMAPVGLIVLWQPLLMWQGDVNVNVFTAMTATIVFGIGVDDAIHIADRIREEGETPEGLQRAVERTGQTVFETSVTTMVGLSAGVLFLSFPGLQNFFGLMMALIGLAFFASVIVLPSLIIAERNLISFIRNQGPWETDEDEIVLTGGESMDAELVNG